jgi:G:T-mismatch repair DNA endonuclease (very short patch repair protein)
MICNRCNKYEVTCRNECKVCGFKKRRKLDIDKVINNGFWNMEELEIIIYNILYQKVECINDIVPLLNNKTLDDLANLLSFDLTIRGTSTHKIKLKCDVCGKEYLNNISVYIKGKDKHSYCSFECRNKGFSVFESHKGEKNSRYNSIMIKCTNCEKEYLAPKYIQEQTNSYGENNHFCCQECYWEYRHKHYVKEKNGNYGIKFTKERLLRMSEITTKRICNGDFPQTETKPHLKTNYILNKLNIHYINEYNCKYHSLDIFLDDYNLGIEVMGDYWHGSPIKYKKEELSKIQLKGIKQDKSKHTYVKKYHNFEILYLWEYDINNNTDVCKKLIKLYIKNKGIINDYNSFNYYVNDNKELLLKEKIIYPYFIKQNP